MVNIHHQNRFHCYQMITCIISAWSPVVRATFIQFDLESTPLQIKTDSITGNDAKIEVETYTADTFIGGLYVMFNSPIRYYISYCASYTDLPVQPTEEVDKIWTFRKTATSFTIECNGVEVLNYQFSDSTETYCVSKWGGDVVDQIKFRSTDTASDSYRAKPTGIEN